MRNRDYRRLQRDKAINRTFKWLKGYELRYADMSDAEILERAKKRQAHPQTCSGHCCGNPRKWFNEITMQERRAFQAAPEDE